MSHRRTERSRDRPTSLGRLPNFVMSILGSPQESPRRRDAGPLRKEAAGVKPRWKRKMLFEFSDAVPRHEVEGIVVVDVAG